MAYQFFTVKVSDYYLITMLKKTIVAFCVLILIVAIGITVLYYPKKAPLKSFDAITAIPVNASFILQVKKTQLLHKKLFLENTLVKGLIELPVVEQLTRESAQIDSLIESDQQMKSFTDSMQLYISAHPESSNTYRFLFTVKIPSRLNQTLIEQFLQQACNQQVVKHRSYDENTISSIERKSEVLYFAVIKNALFLSYSQMLIEDAVRQSNLGQSLIDNPVFANLYKRVAPTSTSDCMLYINCAKTADLLVDLSSKPTPSLVRDLRNYTEWLIVDGKVDKEAIAFSGYATAKDSLSTYLSLFKNQHPQRFEMVTNLPENTILVVQYGISSFKTYYHDYFKFLETKNSFNAFDQAQSHLKATLKCNPSTRFLNHIDKEMGLFATSETQFYAYFRCDDALETMNSLELLSDTIVKHKYHKQDTAIYKQTHINKLHCDNFLPILLGQGFGKITASYYTIIDNYIVFANSIEDLKVLIDSKANHQNLLKNPLFNSLANNYSNESNLFIYCAIPHALTLISQTLNADLNGNFNYYSKQLKSVGGCIIQFTREKQLMYTHMYLNANKFKEPEPIDSIPALVVKKPKPIHKKKRIVLKKT